VNITGDSNSITFWEQNRYMTITALGQLCPNGTTSLPGSDCTIECLNGWVNSLGLCLPCSNRVCQVGEGFKACTPTTDAFCYPCPTLPAGQGYSVQGNCDLVVFVPPCPINWMPVEACAWRVPSTQLTLLPGATFRDQCRCLDGTVQDPVSGLCIIQIPYPVQFPSRCLFGFYERGVDDVCTSCRIAPFKECPIGFYIAIDERCLSCVSIGNARFLTQGLVINSPLSCEWECKEGFYQNKSLPLQSQCVPCISPGE